MFRILRLQILKHQIHRILELLVILPGFGGIQKLQQGGEILLLLWRFVIDKSDQRTIEQSLGLYPEIFGGLFPVALGIGNDRIHQLQDVLLGPDMGEVAERSVLNEEWFYKEFGIDGEILIDHAWGIEPVRMQDIKSFKPSRNSLSNGQVLPRPYKFAEARIVFLEMIDVLCGDMYRKNLVSRVFTWWVSFDWKSLEECPNYDGPLSIDFYGRLHPKHTNGTVRFTSATSSYATVSQAMAEAFDKKVDHRLLIRRLLVNADKTTTDDGMYQLDLFTDYEALKREKAIQGAMLEIRQRYGKNAVVKGLNMLEGATTMERNEQIGGHKSGKTGALEPSEM